MASLPTPTISGAVADSVRRFNRYATPRVTLLQVASIADEAPQWPSIYRDQYLERFWPTEPFLAGAVFSICSRNASFRWELTGPRAQVSWAQRLLSQADYGRGWQSLIMKLSQDLITLDNGAFLEIIRPARARTKSGRWHDAISQPHPETGDLTWFIFDRHSGEVDWGKKQGPDFEITDSMVDLPIGLAALDSSRCERTGDPLYPVIYTDVEGYRHTLAAHQVAPLSEMPSNRQLNPGRLMASPWRESGWAPTHSKRKT